MKRGFFLPFARDGKKGKEKRNLKVMLTGEIGEIYVWNIIEMYEESTRN